MMGKVEPSRVEIKEFPREDIEFIVDQIIKLNNQTKFEYDESIATTMKTLNGMLEMMGKPMLVVK